MEDGIKDLLPRITHVIYKALVQPRPAPVIVRDLRRRRPAALHAVQPVCIPCLLAAAATTTAAAVAGPIAVALAAPLPTIAGLSRWAPFRARL